MACPQITIWHALWHWFKTWTNIHTSVREKHMYNIYIYIYIYHAALWSGYVVAAPRTRNNNFKKKSLASLRFVCLTWLPFESRRSFRQSRLGNSIGHDFMSRVSSIQIIHWCFDRWTSHLCIWPKRWVFPFPLQLHATLIGEIHQWWDKKFWNVKAHWGTKFFQSKSAGCIGWIWLGGHGCHPSIASICSSKVSKTKRRSRRSAMGEFPFTSASRTGQLSVNQMTCWTLGMFAQVF